MIKLKYKSSETRTMSLTLFSLLLLFSIFIQPNAMAESTDEYLKGLDEEVSSPEYLSKAKRELLESEEQEKRHKQLSPDAKQGLQSITSFEQLLKTEFPASHNIYTQLSKIAQKNIFKHFQKTKLLSSTKRMIIKEYLAAIS